MNHITQNHIAQEWVDKGYWTMEYDDHVIGVGYKDKVIERFSQSTVTREGMDATCERHQSRLYGAVGVMEEL